jgi:toxin ParE1/3/4
VEKSLPIFHPAVAEDVSAAAEHYERRSPGLGRRFKKAFYSVVDGLLVFPARHAVKYAEEIRTVVLRPFPYLVFYAVDPGVVYVVAVQYAGRDPENLETTLKERLGS